MANLKSLYESVDVEPLQRKIVAKTVIQAYNMAGWTPSVAQHQYVHSGDEKIITFRMKGPSVEESKPKPEPEGMHDQDEFETYEEGSAYLAVYFNFTKNLIYGFNKDQKWECPVPLGHPDMTYEIAKFISDAVGGVL